MILVEAQGNMDDAELLFLHDEPRVSSMLGCLGLYFEVDGSLGIS